jgi:hypothetical protein
MIVGGFSYAGTLSRPGGAGASQPTGGAAVQAPVEESRQSSAEDPTRPAYFRAISSISHGSLAAAYQVMRAHDAAMPPQPAFDAAPAINSGLGIPSAMKAYGEAIAYGED